MSVFLKGEGMGSIEPLIIKTHKAAGFLRQAKESQIKGVLTTLAALLEKNGRALLRANAQDLSRQDPTNPRNDRLMLNAERIAAIAGSIRKVSRLPDPSGKILTRKKLSNGLR